MFFFGTSGLAGAMGRGAQLSLFGGAADAHGDPGPATRRLGSWESENTSRNASKVWYLQNHVLIPA